MKDLSASQECLQALLDKGNLKSKDVFDSTGLIARLTALCDLLTIMILAIDENQRLNMKPKVETSKKEISDGAKQQKTGSENTQDELEGMEIDPALLDSLQEEFKTQKQGNYLSGQA
jgi:hypothetical protein